MWSLGCILYAMLFGRYPFEANEREELKAQITTQQIKITGDGLTADCLDLVRGMLAKEPEQRVSIFDILHHPWLMNHKQTKTRKFDWTKVSDSDSDCMLIEQQEEKDQNTKIDGYEGQSRNNE